MVGVVVGGLGGAGSGGVVADKLGVDGGLCCDVGLWMMDVAGRELYWMVWTTCWLLFVVAGCIDGECCCREIGWCWEWRRCC